MRRQRRGQYYDEDDYQPSNQPLPHNGDTDDILQMEPLSRGAAVPHRFENTIEAKVELGDTLQALALRFHCTVTDIKRLNKIDRDNEIHARKVIKIPITVHSVLLQSLPAVHKSGNNSPKHSPQSAALQDSSTLRNPLEDARIVLSEKLLVASVNAAGVNASSSQINNTILNSGGTDIYTDADHVANSDSNDDTSALLTDMFDDENVPYLRPIRGPALSAIDWSGSDCDMSWVCLFVFILALCFVIPLIYVIYLAEHPHHHNTTSH